MIYGLSNEGAEFVLQTADQWPTDTTFEFGDDVPDDLCVKLETLFHSDAN